MALPSAIGSSGFRFELFRGLHVGLLLGDLGPAEIESLDRVDEDPRRRGPG